MNIIIFFLKILFFSININMENYRKIETKGKGTYG